MTAPLTEEEGNPWNDPSILHSLYVRYFWWVIGLRAGYGWGWVFFWVRHGTRRRPVVGGRD